MSYHVYDHAYVISNSDFSQYFSQDNAIFCEHFEYLNHYYEEYLYGNPQEELIVKLTFFNQNISFIFKQIFII